MAQYGVGRGLDGDEQTSYDAAERPYTPAWQEKFTGVGRDTVVRFAREWATTAERTGGKCTVIIGSGVNHWFHANLMYRASIASLMLCGCIGVNGGGLNHYTGQEKCAPGASWSTLAMALDWMRPPRLQNGPSFHYVHSDQWRYEGAIPDPRGSRKPLRAAAHDGGAGRCGPNGLAPVLPAVRPQPASSWLTGGRAGGCTDGSGNRRSGWSRR